MSRLHPLPASGALEPPDDSLRRADRFGAGTPAGTASDRVMSIVTDRSQGLFPGPREMTFDCSCPDWAEMCKHVAAVLYGVGARLDGSPELLFRLRGVDHLDLVGRASIQSVVSRPSSREGRGSERKGSVRSSGSISCPGTPRGDWRPRERGAGRPEPEIYCRRRRRGAVRKPQDPPHLPSRARPGGDRTRNEISLLEASDSC